MSIEYANICSSVQNHSKKNLVSLSQT